MSFQIKFNCMPSKIDENANFKNVINGHAQTIIDLQDELDAYKTFYSCIVDNNIINDKFEEYNNIIKRLQDENRELKDKLKIN